MLLDIFLEFVRVLMTVLAMGVVIYVINYLFASFDRFRKEKKQIYDDIKAIRKGCECLEHDIAVLKKEVDTLTRICSDFRSQK